MCLLAMCIPHRDRRGYYAAEPESTETPRGMDGYGFDVYLLWHRGRN
jgi:hypothetical protein